jgi:hypothetical protein
LYASIIPTRNESLPKLKALDGHSKNLHYGYIRILIVLTYISSLCKGLAQNCVLSESKIHGSGINFLLFETRAVQKLLSCWTLVRRENMVPFHMIFP